MKTSVDQVLVGDCLELLQRLPEAWVDLVFADPPYNLQLRHELWRPNRTRVDAVDDLWDHFGSFAEYDAFTRAWLNACRRVLKPTGTLWVIGTYHNIYRVGSILQDLGYWILNDVIWVKTNPMPNFRGVRFTNAHETLLWAQKERGASYTFHHHAMRALNEELQMRSDWQLPVCTGRERLKVRGEKAHSTQKPEALLYRVILSSSNSGDVVLDPFFGTGTTGAVAKRLRRHWIGIEQEAKYARLARKRIEAVTPLALGEEDLAPLEPRRALRIPFGSLIELGLLEPGTRLYLGEEGNVHARVLADGSLRWQDTRGSIHQVAQAVRGAPANGWEVWFFEDPRDRVRKPIHLLRETARALLSSAPAPKPD
ncbi:MAG: DNA methyltransferase [Anaerolineales bacterium]|jgi:modification methylase